ncbi:polyamine aminopropyltransferase [Geitlerinema sp. P-1104]|uniref:polyamine aminopropyltransferase n=1 Tax=Geitlerinema sp. P-1104 TaxID=2546230 RepID=UPI0014771750|nr:polyamine aminopropyltransferase [Geitlerinema sp. P-1104]NMG60616.1 polyamine aminopropyltransferase [Geitlerinema sp. P-1104]
MAGSDVKADLWITEYITPWDIYIHGVTKLLAFQQTQYQEMHIVETGAYGKALVLDGKWQSCTGDEFLYHEPLVHPACLAHGNPRKVLILGGGEGATLREVLRWTTVEQAVMVDIDGDVVAACRQHLPEMHQNSFDDPRAELVIGDALQYLDETQVQWDVVISDLSDPIEEGPSFQLFTKEYFQQIRDVLSPQGQFVVQAGPVAPEELQLHARIVNTLKDIFPQAQSYHSHVPTYASPWGFALASQEGFKASAEEIDRCLAEKTTGGLRMFDGITWLGLSSLPLHLRQAIEQETEVYTKAQPPKFFGKGVVKGEA